jgi:hypothetical protein
MMLIASYILYVVTHFYKIRYIQEKRAACEAALKNAELFEYKAIDRRFRRKPR